MWYRRAIDGQSGLLRSREQAHYQEKQPERTTGLEPATLTLAMCLDHRYKPLTRTFATRSTHFALSADLWNPKSVGKMLAKLARLTSPLPWLPRSTARILTTPGTSCSPPAVFAGLGRGAATPTGCQPADCSGSRHVAAPDRLLDRLGRQGEELEHDDRIVVAHLEVPRTTLAR